jgi:2-polyprenyl-3-methyl-5-hydroxy-6-metoxy-1,4-benzoquinol methylase
MDVRMNGYDACAIEYAEMVAEGETAGLDADPVVPHLLDLVGDVTGLVVLDAGCGEGTLARILATRGASVTAIDISPRLVEMACTKAFANQIAYHVADLSRPLPSYEGYFDLIASHFVLNDVYDYQGFIDTLATLIKPGGRIALSMNNLYSFIVRNHLKNYFDSGAFPYRSMVERGVNVHFYQRTLEEYVDAFLAASFQLEKPADLPTPEQWLNRRTDGLLPQGYQFPYIMLLSFKKL